MIDPSLVQWAGVATIGICTGWACLIMARVFRALMLDWLGEIYFEDDEDLVLSPD